MSWQLPVLKIRNYKIPSKYYLPITVYILVLTLPWVTQQIYIMRFLVFTSIYAIFAASFDILAGYTNQINLGHAIFFGAGAYGAAFLNLVFELSPWLTLLLGAVVAMAVGFILGVLCLRVRGPYLLLTTALVNVVLISLVYSFSEITGGEDGLPGNVYPGKYIKRLFISPQANYLFSSILMMVSIIILLVFTKSRMGLALKTIRDQEITAEAIGVNTVKYKLIAFTLSGFFAGLAGSYYIHFLGSVGPTTLSFEWTFDAIIIAVLGGWGTIVGSVLGAYILIPLDEILRFLGGYRTVAYGVIVLFFIFFARRGILGALKTLSEKLKPRDQTSSEPDS